MIRSRSGSLLLALAAGVLLGWLGAAPLRALSWGNLVLWGVVNVGLGLIAGSKGEKVVRLGLYGFTLGFAFMCFGYNGAASLLSRTPFFAVVGIFSALCAVLVGGLVHLVVSRRS
jgi:hypothetical protein